MPLSQYFFLSLSICFECLYGILQVIQLMIEGEEKLIEDESLQDATTYDSGESRDTPLLTRAKSAPNLVHLNNYSNGFVPFLLLQHKLRCTNFSLQSSLLSLY